VTSASLTVHLNGATTDSEVAATRAAFEQSGFAAEIRTDWPLASRSIDVWTVVVAVPAGYFLKALAEQAGSRAADALADLVGRIRRSRKGDGRVEIGEPATSAVLIISGEVPVQDFAEVERAVEIAQPGDQIEIGGGSPS
jgi:hypothetical protein